MKAALALLALALPAGAADISLKRQELIEVQRQLEGRKREIEEFRRQEADLKRDVSRLKDRASESHRRLTEMEGRIRDSESKKSALEARAAALQTAEGRWREVLGDELRGYQRWLASDFEYHGARGVWEESLRRAAILDKLRYLDGVRGTRRRTEAAEAEVRRVAASLHRRSLGARAEFKSRETLLERTEAAFRETRGKVEAAARSLRELQDSALALTRLVRALEKKSPYRIPGERIPLAEAPHSLPWPAEGRVVASFGREPVRELNTVIIHQGIRIATEPGAPVRPVKAGKVIFAGPFRSYGKVLIVDHGQGFYTIYGRLGALAKGKGDAVTPEETIAAAGEPEARAGSKPEPGGVVYFEVRQSGEALDPIQWLVTRAPARGE